MALSDSLIELKVIPMGESPKNRPANPTMLKLSETDSTASSTISNLFCFVANRMVTRQ
jgi:hypothetical protein